MLPWHERGVRERGKKITGRIWLHQNDAIPASPAFLYWRRDSYILRQNVVPHCFPLSPEVIFLQEQAFFRDCCAGEVWITLGGLRRLGFRRAGFKFPLFQPESCVTRVDCFALIAWKAVWERVIWRLLLNLLQRCYLVEFAIPVSFLWKSMEEMSLIFCYEQ